MISADVPVAIAARRRMLTEMIELVKVDLLNFVSLSGRYLKR